MNPSMKAFDFVFHTQSAFTRIKAISLCSTLLRRADH